MACRVSCTCLTSVTPESELVVAPAGYILYATTPAATASFTCAPGGGAAAWKGLQPDRRGHLVATSQDRYPDMAP